MPTAATDRACLITVFDGDGRLVAQRAGATAQQARLAAGVDDHVMATRPGDGPTTIKLSDGRTVQLAAVEWIELAEQVPAPGALNGDPRYAGITLAHTLRPDFHASNRRFIVDPFNAYRQRVEAGALAPADDVAQPRPWA